MSSTATMRVVNENRSDLAQPLTKGSNKELTDLSVIDPNMIRQPDYWVFLYTVADREFNVSRPSLNISKFTVPKCEDAISDKNAYRLVWKVPSPYPLPYSDQTTGEIKLNTVVAERIAMDICNPNQKSTDMEGYIAPESIIGYGDDLVSKGLFFVHERHCTFSETDKDHKQPIPPKSAILAAVVRKEKYYNDLLDKAKGLEYSDQKRLNDFIAAEPDVHLACEYFGIETSWHQVRVQKKAKKDCEKCGTEVVAGLAYHPLPGSRTGLCISNWDQAIADGVVSETDRPVKK